MAAGLTIAIPFHRDLHYLEQAVRSALDQEDGELKLLVVDDGEQEQGVARLLEGFGDGRISYHRNPTHLGMVRNWNQCLELVETELVTLLHADDQLLGWCLTNAVAVKDRQDRWMMDKANSVQKIDPLVSLLMGFARAMVAPGRMSGDASESQRGTNENSSAPSLSLIALR